MNNIIYLEWVNKKNFPKGIWLKEPDLCYWVHNNMSCLTIRDMSLGVWKGFVGVNKCHPFYSKSIDELIKTDETIEIFFSVYGGICSAGSLISKYKEYDNSLWWIGIETSHGADYMPLLKLNMQNADIANVIPEQTYKNFAFIRRETNKLARCLSRI